MTQSLFARLSAQFGERPSDDSRRAFLHATAAAGAALLVPGCASGPRRVVNKASKEKVVVIGAGLAGLCAAHELSRAGAGVTVLEARGRIGGRVLTVRDLVPGETVEGGGELIGRNHPCWMAFAERYKLELMDVAKDDGTLDPIVIDGKKLEFPAAAELWESMNKALSQMNTLAKDVDEDRPWNSAGAKELDARTIAGWINSLDVDSMTKQACWILLASDNGQDPAKMSLLCQLACVKAGGLEKFWTETEAFRCRGGNDQLAKKLGEEIGWSKIRLRSPVKSIDARRLEANGHASPCLVSLSDGTTVECDHVVLAVPPPVWSSMGILPPMPEDLVPQTGVNTKYLARVKRRFWKDEKLSQYALGDLAVAQTWDATDGQDGGGSDACLTGFCGGPHAVQTLAWRENDADERFSPVLSQYYSAYGNNFVRGRFMDWPNRRWTECGYSFPAPGQVTTVGPLLERGLSRLQFAGEHCCYKFVGYMEGALQSGVAAAKRILHEQAKNWM